MRPLWIGAALSAVIAAAPVSARAQSGKPFTVTVDTEALGVAQAYGVAPSQSRDRNAVDVSAQGDESAGCQPRGRQSAARASGSVSVIEQTDTSLSLGVSALSTARAGRHQRACSDSQGRDTKGSAEVSLAARIRLAYGADHPPGPYRLRVDAPVEGLGVRVRLLDRAGNEVALAGAPAAGATLEAQPGAVYFAEIVATAAAGAADGCCEDRTSGTGRIDLRWEPAPILAARQRLEPYIKGGVSTTRFENVGAFTVDGQMHCTGTVVGRRTVLTAAHCVWGYEGSRAAMRFVLGSNVVQPSEGPFEIESWEYPKGIPHGYRYDPSTHADDIALVYVASDIAAEPVSLMVRDVPWEAAKSKSLTFVGFGFDVVGGQKEGIGIKREASWTISGIESRRVSFQVPKRNTCKGDSGGPAFWYDETDPLEKRRMQVAVTSTGDAECSFGYETRLDAYSSWLDGKIR